MTNMMNHFACSRLLMLTAIAVMAGCGRPSTPAATSGSAAELEEVDGLSASMPTSAHSEEQIVGEGERLVAPSLEDIVGIPEEPGQSSGMASLRELRKQRDQTVWKKESLAQEYERAIVDLWDRLLGQQQDPDGDQFAVLAGVQFDTVKLPVMGPAKEIRWDAIERVSSDTTRIVTRDDWPAQVTWFQNQGYRIVQTEWHHAKFDISDDSVAKSTISMAIYAEHPRTESRHVVSGDLSIVWQPRLPGNGLPVPASIDATNLKLYSRTGPPVFEEILTIDHARPDTRSGIHPVLLRDMNGDGLSEILLGGCNELYWNRGSGQFEKDQLFDYPEKGFEVGLVADVTGDAIADYVMPGIAGDLLLYVGDSNGRFRSPPKGKARGGGPLKQPQVIAAGDIDRDGDVDLWIGQYKISYVGGQMPSPYFDANDGFPAYLLINEGEGRFVPQTEEAGLAAKRWRRSYGGSFVDLDQDADLDLVVVSDFAGIDVYLNDGQGLFTDVTNQIVDESHLFGMSATFADYNLDGQLDFFVTGMASTTARRLEYMRLGRRDRPEIHMMRSRMGYGNRMYLASNGGTQFTQPSFKDSVARTGWTWGSTSFDFDNDGYPDIFVANGHSSGESTKDHCSHFWCHDIYDGNSQPNLEVLNVFNESMKGYFDRSESWDGYQKNQLLVNLDGQEFVNLGFLLGVGHEYDGRAVISDDIDIDGRLDLIVVEDRWQAGQVLHVYHNRLESKNHWIGVRLVDRPGIDSPLGATVVLTKLDGTRQTECVTAGDSIHAQHAPTVHFGLGSQEGVARIEVRLVSGKVIQLDRPERSMYHTVHVE